MFINSINKSRFNRKRLTNKAMHQEKLASRIKQVACPNCKALTDFTPKNPYRPFCSERCQLTDLGEWASENYKIPEKSASTDVDDLN